MKPFQHGGDITAFANTCGCSLDEVIDLSSNINFVKPHIDIDFNTIDIATYPNYDSLYESIADHYGVAEDQMELFNGGSSAIFSLFPHIKGNHKGLPLRCTVYSPAYLEYKKAAKWFGYALHLIDRFSAMDAEVPQGSLVIFVNPTTPDGVFYDIQSLLKKWHNRDCTVLIDESFIEFTPHTSATGYLAQYPNLFILKSLTKYWGAAGIRMGALLSSAQNIAALRQREPLWKLSAFDAAYIQAVLQDESFAKRSKIANQESRDYLLALLKKSPLVKYIYPSEANFVLVELQGITAKELQERLIPYKVMVRNCENFDTLGKYHVRIALKELKKLQPLKEVFHA
jgi:threonine-phosphate decarboxylase